MKNQLELLRETEWKTLIILDACQYDAFADLHEERGWPGALTKTYNGQRDTASWYRNVVNGLGLRDVILVTSSPSPARYFNAIVNRFYRYVPTYRKPIEVFVQPGPTMTEAEKHRVIFPNKRLIVHLMPPHLPYLGPRGEAFLRRLYDVPPGRKIGVRPQIYDEVEDYARRRNAWAEVLGYYRENVEVGMRAVLENRRWLDGAVVTTDHGEVIGPDIYRHYDTELPWLELP